MFVRAMPPVLATLLGVLVGATLLVAPARAQPVSPTTGSGLIASPAQLQFGSVDVHFGGEPQQSVSFYNGSLAAVTVMSVAVTGPESARFQIVADGCTSDTLAPGSSCAVEIRFQPGAPGEDSAILAVEALGGEGALEVPLSGSGATGTLSADPGTLDFPAIPYARREHEEEQGETEQLNFEDRVAGTQVKSVTIVGPDASSFSIAYGDCEGDQLASGNTCDAGIRFQPVSPGPKQAQLVLESDSSSGPLVVALEGEGLHGPQISLQSNEAQLGEIAIGSSASHTFTITDSGDYPLFIQQSFLVSGTPKMFPLQSNTCDGEIVRPGASCEFTVGFEPTLPGEKEASLVFVTNATPQINVLGIDGVGLLPTLAATSSPAITPSATQTPPPLHPPAGPADTPLLTIEPGSWLENPLGGIGIDTGVAARCPANLGSCEAESIVTARIGVHQSKAALHGSGRAIVLLGSHLTHLHGGERASIHVPLSNKGEALLKKRDHLRATIETVIRAGATIIAEHARILTLVS